MTRTRAVVIVVAGGLAVAGGWTVVNMAKSSAAASSAGPLIPTERVARGAMDLDVYMDGDLRVAKSVSVVAPSVGGNLRILTLLDTGSIVKAGDVVLAFDPGEQQYAVEQSASELEEAAQEIRKRQADVTVQLSQDKVALLTARFDVRRAELDAAVDPELVAANEVKIRQLSLEEAKRRVVQVEADTESREATAKASLAVLEERRTKSRMNADRAKTNIDNLLLKAPIDGVVVVRENRDGGGEMFFRGGAAPELRMGDTMFPGRPVFDVFDPTGMEIRTTVNEQERANVSVGQAAFVELKSAAGEPRPAKITAVGSLGRVSSGPLRRFDLTLMLDAVDGRLKPGTTVRIVAKGKRVDGVLSIPRHALFEKDGKSLVYLRRNGEFEPTPVKVLHRNEARVAIEGVDEGAELALIDPVAAAKPKPASAATPPAGPAGPAAPPGAGR